VGGGDPVILGIFYKSFIRSKLDYGSTLYGSASKLHQQKIEIFQNKCLRLIIEALTSTPVAALGAKPGLMPLQFRRYNLTNRILGWLINSLHCSLLDSVSYLTEHWRFVTNDLPLICKRAAVILRFKQFSLPSPSYRLAPFSFWHTLHGLKYHRLPNSMGQSI